VDQAHDLKESAEMHREIFRAIKTKNPGQAKTAMEQHLKMALTAQAVEEAAAEASSEGEVAVDAE
jgi:GntR family transcriptional repressor for pyruvate dehydrogenase complex